jgi:DNA invertase Pin-like site-specific DNA recombinase
MACKERGRLELSRFLILIQSRDHDPGSGTTTEGREALRTVLDFLHPGDVLTVTRIDRLARSIGDLQDIVRTVRARGASLKANRAADRHQHRGRQVLPARCVRGIPDQPASRTPAGGHRQGKGCRRL